jgi:hypothetical protein
MTIGVRSVAAWVAVLIAGSLVAACSSSGGPDTVGPNASKQSTTGSAPASASPADPATKQAITAAFKRFFNSKTTPADSQTALQHGAAFKATLEAQAKGSYSKNSGVDIVSVSVEPSGDVADVTYTLTSNGATLLANIKGFAVKEAGTWKVAAATFCTLLKLEGSPPPACSNASITALPA